MAGSTRTGWPNPHHPTLTVTQLLLTYCLHKHSDSFTTSCRSHGPTRTDRPFPLSFRSGKQDSTRAWELCEETLRSRALLEELHCTVHGAFRRGRGWWWPNGFQSAHFLHHYCFSMAIWGPSFETIMHLQMDILQGASPCFTCWNIKVFTLLEISSNVALPPRGASK